MNRGRVPSVLGTQTRNSILLGHLSSLASPVFWSYPSQVQPRDLDVHNHRKRKAKRQIRDYAEIKSIRRCAAFIPPRADCI